MDRCIWAGGGVSASPGMQLRASGIKYTDKYDVMTATYIWVAVKTFIILVPFLGSRTIRGSELHYIRSGPCNQYICFDNHPYAYHLLADKYLKRHFLAEPIFGFLGSGVLVVGVLRSCWIGVIFALTRFVGCGMSFAKRSGFPCFCMATVMASFRSLAFSKASLATFRQL